MPAGKATRGRKRLSSYAIPPDRHALDGANAWARSAIKTEGTPIPDVTLESLEVFLRDEMGDTLALIDPRPRQDKSTPPPSPFAAIRGGGLASLDLRRAAQDVLDLSKLVSHLGQSDLNRDNPFAHDVELLQTVHEAMTNRWQSVEDARLEARHARLLDGIEQAYIEITQAWPRGAPIPIEGWEDESITQEQEQVECDARDMLRNLLKNYIPELSDDERDAQVDVLLGVDLLHPRSPGAWLETHDAPLQ